MEKNKGRFKVLFYPQNDIWVILDTETGVRLTYSLNQVETDTVMYCAYLYGRLSKDITWEMLSEEIKSELLNWFENEVFPSEYFGRLILSDILEEIKNAKTLGSKP